MIQPPSCCPSTQSDRRVAPVVARTGEHAGRVKGASAASAASAPLTRPSAPGQSGTGATRVITAALDSSRDRLRSEHLARVVGTMRTSDKMATRSTNRLTDPELHDLFDRLL